MINLILADDHSVVRQGLCEMLESKGKYSVIAQANNGKQLIKLLEEHNPDVIIMDVGMPELDGLATLEFIQSSHLPFPPVLILSADETEQSVRAALQAGAVGYLPKNADISELEFAISSVLEGKTYLSPSITAPLMSGSGQDLAEENPLSVLTKRELEILKHLADGKPNREIGTLLHISTRTVDTHRSNILKKLKVKTNAELVKLAISCKVIEV